MFQNSWYSNLGTHTNTTVTTGVDLPPPLAGERHGALMTPEAKTAPAKPLK
jgi:hypothetical protein